MPPRAGAGGPSSQARQSEGPKRSQGPRPGGSTGATGSGRRRRGRWRQEAALRLVFHGLQRVSRPGGAGGWGAPGPSEKGQTRRLRGCSARRPRALGGGGALPLPARPLGGRADPYPAWTRGNTCALWGRPGPGGAGGQGTRSAVEGASVLLGRFGCVQRTPRQSGGEDGGGTSTHSVALGQTRKSLQSLRAWRARGRRVVLIRASLCRGSGSGGSGVTLRLFPDGTEARNFVSFLP